MMKASATGTGANKYCLILFANNNPRHRSGQECDEQIGCEALRGLLSFHQAADYRTQLGAIFPAHRQDRGELDHDLEHLAALVVEVEQIAGQYQMPGGGDRQKLGQPFDDAQYQGFPVNQIHSGDLSISVAWLFNQLLR